MASDRLLIAPLIALRSEGGGDIGGGGGGGGDGAGTGGDEGMRSNDYKKTDSTIHLLRQYARWLPMPP